MQRRRSRSCLQFPSDYFAKVPFSYKIQPISFVAVARLFAVAILFDRCLAIVILLHFAVELSFLSFEPLVRALI